MECDGIEFIFLCDSYELFRIEKPVVSTSGTYEETKPPEPIIPSNKEVPSEPVIDKPKSRNNPSEPIKSSKEIPFAILLAR